MSAGDNEPAESIPNRRIRPETPIASAAVPLRRSANVASAIVAAGGTCQIWATTTSSRPTATVDRHQHRPLLRQLHARHLVGQHRQIRPAPQATARRQQRPGRLRVSGQRDPLAVGHQHQVGHPGQRSERELQLTWHRGPARDPARRRQRRPGVQLCPRHHRRPQPRLQQPPPADRRFPQLRQAAPRCRPSTCSSVIHPPGRCR